MATVDLGKISFVNKGTYDASTTYEERDVVQFTDGALSSYVYINATPASGQTPSTGGSVNSSHWSLFAGGVSIGVGNNKIVTTDGSGNVSSLAIGSTGQFLKVTGSNTLGFATSDPAGLVRIKSVTSTTAHTFSGSTGNPGTTMSGMVAMSSLINDFTPTNASNTLVITAHVVTWKGANGQLFMGIKDTTNTTYLGVGGDYYNSAGSGISGNITIRAVISAGSTTARNYQVFMGATMGGTHAINKDYHGNNNGISSIVVEEYAAAVVA